MKFVQKIDDQWICTQDVCIQLPCDKSVTVPKGFLCDGATGGIDCLGEKEWLAHDWIYANKGQCGPVTISRREADGVFGWKYAHRWLATRCLGWLFWGSVNDIQDVVRPELIQSSEIQLISK